MAENDPNATLALASISKSRGRLSACLVAEIWLGYPVGRGNIVSVGGNQSDFGCPKAGLRRVSLSLLGGIVEIRC